MSTEHQIQSAVVTYCRRMAATDWRYGMLFAVPNGGARDTVTGAKLKAEGVEPGVPDLFLAFPTFTYHGCYVEIKTPKGRVSKVQQGWHERLRRAGYRVEVCRSAQSAINLIKEYLG